MARAHDTIAVLFVDKDWHDRVFRYLVDGRESTAPGDVHLLLAPLLNAEDHHGVWIRVASQAPDAKPGDGMDFMVPWAFVHGFGIYEGSRARVVGFAAAGVTELTLKEQPPRAVKRR